MENTQEYSIELLALNEQWKRKVFEKVSSLESLRSVVTDLLAPHIQQSQVQYIASKFDELLSFSQSYESSEHFNYCSLFQCYECAERLVRDQISAISLVDMELLTKSGNSLEKSKAYMKKYVYVFVDKLREVISFANHGKQLPLDDLFSQPETSQDWKLLKSISKYYEFSPKQVSIENYQGYAGKVFFIVAAMGRSAELVPKTEAEVDEILQKTLADPQPEYPVTMGGAPLKPEHKLDDLTPILLGRFLKYQRDPRKGITDGEPGLPDHSRSLQPLRTAYCQAIQETLFVRKSSSQHEALPPPFSLRQLAGSSPTRQASKPKARTCLGPIHS